MGVDMDVALTLAAPELAFAFEALVQVGPPLEIGPTVHGSRRIVPILGGTFDGPAMKGRVLPGGADWQIVHADGFSELDTRYTLETESGDVIYVQNRGVRHASPAVMTRLLAGEPVDPVAGLLPHDTNLRDCGAASPVADSLGVRWQR